MLDDEMHQAIGEVTVAAASLEYQLTFLAAVARHEDDEWIRQTLGKVGEARRQIDALIEDVAEGAFLQELKRLRRDAFAVLDDRNVIVHSVAMLDRGEDGAVFWTFWHPRSDAEARIDVGQLREHARDLGAVAARSLSISHLANEWRIGREVGG